MSSFVFCRKLRDDVSIGVFKVEVPFVFGLHVTSFWLEIGVGDCL